MRKHYRFTFVRHNKPVEFGPYLSEHEAKEAFQRRYGYWPTGAIKTVEW